MGWSQWPGLEVGKMVGYPREMVGLKTKEVDLSWFPPSLWEERGLRVTLDMPGDQRETGSSPDYFSFPVLQKAACSVKDFPARDQVEVGAPGAARMACTLRW